MLGHRCHLELFVKVEEDWRNKEQLLDEYGLSGALSQVNKKKSRGWHALDVELEAAGA